MAGKISPYVISKIFPHILFQAEWKTAPVNHYLGLLTAEPVGNSFSEVSGTGTGYTRMLITFKMAQQQTDSSTTNSADVVYPLATGNWGTVTHIGIFDSATAGNLFWSGPLSSSVTLFKDDVFKIKAGDFKIAME